MRRAEAYQNRLADGEPIEYPLSGDDRMPGVENATTVWVQAVPMSRVQVGDTVLCREGAEVRLRQVSRTRLLHGVPCLEIFLGDKSIVSRFVREGNYLAKVVPEPSQVAPTTVAPVMPMAPKTWWRSLVGKLRR